MQGCSKKGGLNGVSCEATLAHLPLKRDLYFPVHRVGAGALGRFKTWTFQQGSSDGYDHRVHKEWHWHLSGVHSIMMVNSAQPGKGGVPSPFHTTITSKVVYAPAEKADTLPLFLLYPNMYAPEAIYDLWTE